MTLTTAQQVRLKIQDAPISENVTLYGDGTATVFRMPHGNLTTASAYVPIGGTAWSATGCTVDPTGAFMFSGVISANSAYNVRYIHTTFSDDEITNFLDVGGTILGAALEAVEALMFDAIKRARWMASDGTQYDDTSAQSHLAKMHDLLSKQIEAESTSAGGFSSWAINQGDW
jgi:hypothetical protein